MNRILRIARATKALARRGVDYFTRKSQDFAQGLVRHTEATTILLLSSVGAAVVLEAIPVVATWPAWAVGTLSVMSISLLVSSMNKRMEHRAQLALADAREVFLLANNPSYA